MITLKISFGTTEVNDELLTRVFTYLEHVAKPFDFALCRTTIRFSNPTKRVIFLQAKEDGLGLIDELEDLILWKNSGLVKDVMLEISGDSPQDLQRLAKVLMEIGPLDVNIHQNIECQFPVVERK